MKRAFSVMFLLAFVLACQGRHDSPTAPIAGASIAVSVVENGTSSPIAGARFEVRRERTGPVAYSATTDANGVATITVAPGSYWLTVTPPAGYSLPPGIGSFDSQTVLRPGESVTMQVPLVRT